MITIITGAPGAGKTAALVMLLQETLAVSGRQIYVHGIPDLLIPHEDLTEPDKWFETVPDGSIIIIDEVQTVWRPRGPGQKVPEHIQKLETHRHRGIDFYIITQGPNLVDSNVRALCGRHIHLRDIGFMGRWWYEWPECADQCRTTWKNAPIKKKYRLPKKIFGQYKSASLHVKPIRSFPKMFIVAMLALVAAGFLTYRAYVSISGKVKSPVSSTSSVAPGQPGGPPVSQAVRVGPVDEVTDFLPRTYDRPWTAPAYDQLRKVVSMPTITGAICLDKKCQCFHHHRVVQVPSAACYQWVLDNPFNPYEADAMPSAGNQNPLNSAPAQPAAMTTLAGVSSSPV